MARKNEEITISKGPSKLDLMLSLFDTDMGRRIVKFYQKRDDEGKHGFWVYDVEITSARSRHPTATIWELEGLVNVGGEQKRVSIYYLSDTREGRMRIEDELRTHDILTGPNEGRRAGALMNIIHRMVVICQNHGGLPDEFYKLFEKAKKVKWANSNKSLTEAIEEI